MYVKTSLLQVPFGAYILTGNQGHIYVINIAARTERCFVPVVTKPLAFIELTLEMSWSIHVGQWDEIRGLVEAVHSQP